MTLKFKEFKLEESGKIGGKYYCLDYVMMSAPSLGKNQVFCGKKRTDLGYPLSSIDIPKGEVFITFYTNKYEETTDKGFSIDVVCQNSLAMEANCEVRQSQLFCVINLNCL